MAGQNAFKGVESTGGGETGRAGTAPLPKLVLSNMGVGSVRMSCFLAEAFRLEVELDAFPSFTWLRKLLPSDCYRKKK